MSQARQQNYVGTSNECVNNFSILKALNENYGHFISHGNTDISGPCVAYIFITHTAQHNTDCSRNSIHKIRKIAEKQLNGFAIGIDSPQLIENVHIPFGS